MDLSIFLAEDEYVDFSSPTIQEKANELFHGLNADSEKANLLAALLRYAGIPTGFCFQRLTLADDECLGYCVL